MSETEVGQVSLGERVRRYGPLRRTVLAGALLGAAVLCAGALSPGLAGARVRVPGDVARSSELQFLDFTYLGVSRSQHGLLMELRTETGTASDTSVRLQSEASKKLLVKQNVGTISHKWHRFVLRVHGKAPGPGEYDLEVFQGSTYSATFYLTVK